MTRTSWQELPRWQRTTILVVAPVELALTVYAAVDLTRRHPSNIRGHKAVWWPLLLVQPLGPVAYLLRGRRRP
ncbi:MULTISPECIES: PLDc N-terminal domain-containing protein [Actinoplanes]|uniref:PLDc N-terminal domain-containing protein n=1 Tax=Actinoplanes TaxID=1865 RepID=UPI0005F277D5|nr:MULTISPECIES: PLDc N-terminal domain-containing protein [Actinoplanes]GLY02844.1 hypothetical protein Acsp01_32230 [Actinoplanes sp. NBRC 101535]